MDEFTDQEIEKLNEIKVGDTPLDEVEGDNGQRIWCKLEYLNPTGSSKDRIAREIVLDAIAWAKSQQPPVSRPELTVVEASSGSTSIALAFFCNRVGIRFVAILPEGVSQERLLTLQAYGADYELVPGGIAGAQRRARQLGGGRLRGWFSADQFEQIERELPRPHTKAHRVTALEIFSTLLKRHVASQVKTELSQIAVVAGVGTGGTLMGIREFCQGGAKHWLSELDELGLQSVHREKLRWLLDNSGKGESLRCVRFYVARLQSGKGILHDIGFTTAGHRENIFGREKPSDVQELSVEEDRAVETTYLLWKRGYPVGPASGVNYAAAATVDLGELGTVVTVFTDRMDRYFSTALFESVKRRMEADTRRRQVDEFMNDWWRATFNPNFWNDVSRHFQRTSAPTSVKAESEPHENMEAVYDATLELIDQHHGTPTIAEAGGKPGELCLLDFGCGDGAFFRHVVEPKKSRAVLPLRLLRGIDHAQEAISSAQQAFTNRAHDPMHVYFTVGGVRDLERLTRGQRYDYITALQVLMFLSDAEVTVFGRTFAKKLRSGGLLLCAVYNPDYVMGKTDSGAPSSFGKVNRASLPFRSTIRHESQTMPMFLRDRQDHDDLFCGALVPSPVYSTRLPATGSQPEPEPFLYLTYAKPKAETS